MGIKHKHHTKHCRKCKKHHKSHKKDKNVEVKLVSISQTDNISNITGKTITASVPDSIWVMGAPVYWKQNYKGEGVIIGIIDTGIDSSHPVLQNKVIKRRDYVKDNLPQTSFNMHGTHVAGTICADSSNLNSSNLKGVAPAVKLIDYRVLNASGSGSFASVTQAIRDSVVDGCKIINLSLGGSSDYAPMREAVKYAVSKNVLVVVAAGNEGPGKISYPANYPEVISVGALEYNSSTGSLTLPTSPWFSNTNPQVDVSSDGWNVYSSIPGGKYATLSGTSMATPHVSGFSALIINRLTDKLNRTPTGNEVYTVLKYNTINNNSLNKNNLMGEGFVSVYSELPIKEAGKWYFPGLVEYQPPI